MKSVLLRGAMLGAVLLVVGVATYLADGVMVAFAVASAAALLASAFVASPMTLSTQSRSRQNLFVVVLTAWSLALGAIGAAFSDAPFMVIAFVIALIALTVFLVRSAAVNSQG